ncbi:MAG: hemolysin family protein [Nitriliruptorales bacterium]
MSGTIVVGIAVVVVVVLVAATAVFAASETVLGRLGVVRALRLREEGRRGADQLVWLLDHPARGLNVILLLTILTRVTAAAIVTALAFSAGRVAVSLAVVGLVVASFALAEVAPRTFTLRRLERTGLALAPVVAGVARILAPVVRPLVALGGAAAGRRGPGPFSSDEEFRRLMGMEEAEVETAGEEEERAMIRSIFELGDTVCREIMVPRPDMVMVNTDDTLDGVVETAIERGYSRIPVWEDDRDNIVGVVYAKDLLERLYEEPNGRGWTHLMREPTFVPESKRADELLRELQQQKIHLAIVVDEYGAVVGLVAIEDILEEIVGEIVDEFDHEEPPVVRLDENRLRVSARLTVHDLNELVDADLPEDEGWDTVGGLLLAMLGRVPEAGESVQVEGLTLVAERVQGRRVSKVLVTVEPQDDRAPEPAK